MGAMSVLRYKAWLNAHCGEGLAVYLAVMAFFLPLSPAVTNHLLVGLPALLLWAWRQHQLASLTERKAALLFSGFAVVGALSLLVSPRFGESAFFATNWQ